MLWNTRLGKQFRNVVKVFCVAVAVYLALVIKIWHTGETDEVVKYDYLDEETGPKELLDNIDESEDHWASSVFFQLCAKYRNVCSKVNWAGNFTDEDKSLKFAYVTYLLKKLDTNITRWKNPSEALLAMLINEKNWTRRWSADRSTITINL